MTYHLEALGDERFQQLCQALLVAFVPDIQCLPVGQPDGGRDAFRRQIAGQSGESFAIYQVKYTKEPASKNARDVIEQVIRSERSKVQRLIARGATSYFLMTNVAGTSHLDNGSVDKVNKLMSDAFQIPAFCWWRDDIERRLETKSDIRWSYPEILKATDLLEALFEGRLGEAHSRRLNAIRSYMTVQARHDAQLKFKQIELQKTILDLFVDVPARLAAPAGEDPARFKAKCIRLFEQYGIPILQGDDSRHESPDGAVGAHRLMIEPGFAQEYPRIVIEGAPGQGKSTVTQYLCQVHRLQLLGRATELRKIEPDFRSRSARIPFRVDLRDYASWLAGRNPFADDPNEKLPSTSPPVLESFIAAQVNRSTGVSFNVEDLVAISNVSQILVVLDGFDEVADVKLRNKIVSEVSEAAERIASNAISSQVVVTSRPAVFANSPGFPRDEWQYLEILPLSTKIIEKYADRWLKGRDADSRERSAVTTVLKEQLSQSHVRDLARNPMQLAILLALITVQGASLPSKRTALYDKYIEIFLNRESEKSEVVRDHRDILVQFHRYLAWLLHCDAEESGAGHISEARLKESLRCFLEANDHPADLVNNLFTGMVERVVALVSRVQGTFEFEVQPLREYFAARHLYDTAPYAPAGRPARGALPERFDALARNFYWLNVTRFYAGCYSSGELASLVDGVAELLEARQFSRLGYVAQFAVTLINDQVFAQQPRSGARLGEMVAKHPSLLVHLGELQYGQRDDSLALPANCGRGHILAFAKNLIEQSPRYDMLSAASQILILNSTPEEAYQYWRGLHGEMPAELWWYLAGCLDITHRIPANEFMMLESADDRYALQAVCNARREDILEAIPGMWDRQFVELVRNPFAQVPAHGTPQFQTAEGRLAERLGTLLWPFSISPLANVEMRRSTVKEAMESMFRQVREVEAHPVRPSFRSTSFEEVSDATEQVFESSTGAFLNDPSTWARFLDACKVKWGPSWSLYLAGITYAVGCSITDAEHADLCNESVAPLHRAISAKLQAGDVEWWRTQLEHSLGACELERRFAIVCAVQWMNISQILSLSKSLSSLAESLPSSVWNATSNVLNFLAYREQSSAVSVRADAFPVDMSPLLVAILLPRLKPNTRKLAWKKYLKHYEGIDRAAVRAKCSEPLEFAGTSVQTWEWALAAIAAAYSQGHVIHYSFSRRQERQVMPQLVAERVCANPTVYPLEFVGVAANALRVAVGASTIPVGKLALRDEWFEDLFTVVA